MIKKVLLNKGLVIVVLVMFVGAGIAPVSSEIVEADQDVSSLTFYTFSRTGTKKCKVELDRGVAEEISVMFEDLKDKLTCNPDNDQTIELKNDFFDLLDVNGLIPVGLSRDYVFSLLSPRWLNWFGGNSPFSRNSFLSSLGSRFKNSFVPGSFSHTGTAFFCSMAGGGFGLMFPPVMIPRPRIATVWSSFLSADTIAANLYTGHGFSASGSQFGVALGFMGVGLSFAIPGQPAFFGFGGYALYTMVGAEEVVNYPLNIKPVISEEIPMDGSKDVSLSLSELSFRIRDGDGERMSYWVTTEPDIGSDEGHMKKDGRYSVSVSGLEPNNLYSWTVSVSDGEDTTEETFSFNTVVEAPYVSDPNPVDGDSWVSADLSELSFRLEDLQGDLMDYSVETVPDIGSGSDSGVGNGVYSIDVSGLDYTTDYSWFVNVTDGKYWTREVFSFKTEPIMVFDPFDEGWQYRKKITVDHSKVAGDLSDFPVLVNVVDSDLSSKAQVDGDDILFMDGPGVASRLFHEIERYDSDTGTLVTWVGLPEISGSSDIDFYMYYGNPTCSNQEYPERVWCGEYRGVWHLNENPTGVISDSSNNNNDGLSYGHMTSSDLVDGIIGYCLDFDGIDDYVDVGDIIDFNVFSFSLWFKTDADKHGQTLISNYKHCSNNNIGFTCIVYRGDGNFQSEPRMELLCLPYGVAYHAILYDNQWYHVVGVINENDISLYIDNDLKGIVSGNYRDTSDSVKIASAVVKEPCNDPYFNGIIDEVRIYKKAVSDDWVKTDYQSIKYGYDGGFFSVGLEETPP